MTHDIDGYDPSNNVKNLLDLKGKVALVVGSAYGGLGYYSSEALAEAGAKLAISDIAPKNDELAHAKKNLDEIGTDVMTLNIDVSDLESVKKGVEKVEEAYGQIDILLNTAGIVLRQTALEMTVEEWKKLMDINLMGAWLIDTEVARSMIKKGKKEGRRIINLASGHAVYVGPYPEPAYVASKAGLVNLSRDLAMEWAPYGITVNCIAPGIMYPTFMTKNIDAAKLESFAKMNINGKVGNPKRDLKGATVFLASEASEHVTAQVIFVNGGRNAW